MRTAAIVLGLVLAQAVVWWALTRSHPEPGRQLRETTGKPFNQRGNHD
jgi:hypothetical protein